MIPIALILATRPDYTRQVIESLSRCRGIADCVILPHVEPGNEEVRGLAESIDFAESIPTWNANRIGSDANILAGIKDGFRRGEYVCLVEDDVIVSPDFLEFHAWARDRYRGDGEVFSVTAYNRRPDPRADPCPDVLRFKVGRRRWHHGWGSGLWRDRWQSVADRLGTITSSLDATIKANGIDADGRCEVYPELSRCNNIGIETSTGTGYSAEWYRENHFLRHWAGLDPIPVGTFHE